MAAVLKKFGNLSNRLLAKNKFCHCIIKRHNGDKSWETFSELLKPVQLRKWMPGRFPKTEEERVKAAEKYDMHPHEYVAGPIDEVNCGDYPDLPWIGAEAKDPYYPWDFPALRRNFNEPMHRQYDAMGEDRWAYGVRTQYDYFRCSIIFVVFFISSFIIFYVCPNSKPALAEKQYPGRGVHYTFEPAK
ncbi:NADH:ubiquinone oxidoreductase subunit ASHI [Colletes latitarsis]|uniref:NADH:ubiquinone oxidoreductase subunit ASHI n=1 Tax=Colletes latitarsis TaxID=2605962 RepID=UPI00403546D7